MLDASAAPGSFASGLSTEALVLRAGYGDVEAAFGAAHAVVGLDLTVGRHSGVPIETRGASSASTLPVTCWNCTARPRCRTATATRWRACSAAARRQWY